MAKLKAINPDAKPFSEIAEYRKPTKFAELDIMGNPLRRSEAHLRQADLKHNVNFNNRPILTTLTTTKRHKFLLTLVYFFLMFSNISYVNYDIYAYFLIYIFFYTANSGTCTHVPFQEG